MSKKLIGFVFLLAATIGIFFQNCAASSDNLSQFEQISSSKSAENEVSNTNSSLNNGNNNTYYTFPGSSISFFRNPSIANTSTASSTSNSSISSTINKDSIAPGSRCSYVKSLAGLGYQQLLNDYSAAFDGSFLKQGEQLNWASGILTRNSDGSLNYADPVTPANNFVMKKTDSPKKIALEHFNIHKHWMKQYGVQFGQTQTQIWGAANALTHLFGYPMDANKSFPLGFLNLTVTTDSIPGNYTFHTPEGPMNSVQFLSSNWCLAMTSDWGQCEP